MEKYGFVGYEYDKQNKLLFIKRFSENTDDDYKESILFMGEIIKQYKPELILVDTLDYNYPIGPGVQDWATRYLTEICLKTKVKKVVYVMTKDLIAKLALSEMLDNAYKLGLRINYFSDPQEAKNWLFK